MDVCVKESGARFRFNFADVYWNSRLSTEHGRLVNLITTNKSKSCCVADMMAGVGPFAVPLAMSRECIVHANGKHAARTPDEMFLFFLFIIDLNPHSFKYLKINSESNGCKKFLNCYNLDGREFIYKLVADGVDFDHAILNLPGTAISFLDCFIGLGRRISASITKENPCIQPRIHVYCFSNAADPALDAVQRAAEVLSCDTSEFGPPPYHLQPTAEAEKKTTVHFVRDVAPKKYMLCLSFTLPLEVSMRVVPKQEEMTTTGDNTIEVEERAKKRCKTEIS